jgi:hypothetical protein
MVESIRAFMNGLWGINHPFHKLSTAMFIKQENDSPEIKASFTLADNINVEFKDDNEIEKRNIDIIDEEG